MEEILKLLCDYLEKGYAVDQAFINRLVAIVIDIYHLKGYINNVGVYSRLSTKDNFLKYSLGDYDFKTRDLNIFYNAIKEYVEKSYMFPLLNEQEQLLFFNTMFIQLILHEIEHANQLKKMNNEKTIETDILNLTRMNESYLYQFWKEINAKNPNLYPNLNSYINFRQQTYFDNHTICPYERLADYTANEMAVNVLKAYNGSDKVLSYFETKQISGLFSAYKISNPPTISYIVKNQLTDKMQEWEWADPNYFKMQENIKNLLSKEERIKLGLPIDDFEYLELADTYISKKKTLKEVLYGKR